ncbi:MAG: sigma factor [Acidobacteriota bacterium]
MASTPSSTPLHQLLQRCLAARRDSDWDDLVRILGRRLRGFVRAASGSAGVPVTEADIDELVQDLYLQLLTRGQGFAADDDEAVWSFLRCAAKNQAIDRRRRRQAGKRFQSGEPIRLGDLRSPRRVAQAAEESRAPRGPKTPVQRLIRRERRRQFLDLCDRSPVGGSSAQRVRAMGLAFLEGLTSKEICRVVVGMVPREVDRMVHRLRLSLAAEGIDLPHR